MEHDPPAWSAALSDCWRRNFGRRRIASALLFIIGGALGVFALGTAYTVGVAVAPFSAAALTLGGALYPTTMRLLWGLFGAVVLVGWIAGVLL